MVANRDTIQADFIALANTAINSLLPSNEHVADLNYSVLRSFQPENNLFNPERVTTTQTVFSFKRKRKTNMLWQMKWIGIMTTICLIMWGGPLNILECNPKMWPKLLWPTFWINSIWIRRIWLPLETSTTIPSTCWLAGHGYAMKNAAPSTSPLCRLITDFTE